MPKPALVKPPIFIIINRKLKEVYIKQSETGEQALELLGKDLTSQNKEHELELAGNKLGYVYFHRAIEDQHSLLKGLQPT